MEFKKKTIIWEDNNEPPKDYIWIKSDGKAYEFDYKDRKWVKSNSISTEASSNENDEGDEKRSWLDRLTITENHPIAWAHISRDEKIAELVDPNEIDGSYLREYNDDSYRGYVWALYDKDSFDISENITNPAAVFDYGGIEIYHITGSSRVRDIVIDDVVYVAIDTANLLDVWSSEGIM